MDWISRYRNMAPAEQAVEDDLCQREKAAGLAARGGVSSWKPARGNNPRPALVEDYPCQNSLESVYRSLDRMRHR